MKQIKQILFILPVIYLLLLIPDSADTNINKSNSIPYSLNKERSWEKLEEKFKKAKETEKASKKKGKSKGEDEDEEVVFGEEETGESKEAGNA